NLSVGTKHTRVGILRLIERNGGIMQFFQQGFQLLLEHREHLGYVTHVKIAHLQSELEIVIKCIHAIDQTRNNSPLLRERIDYFFRGGVDIQQGVQQRLKRGLIPPSVSHKQRVDVFEVQFVLSRLVVNNAQQVALAVDTVDLSTEYHF